MKAFFIFVLMLSIFGCRPKHTDNFGENEKEEDELFVYKDITPRQLVTCEVSLYRPVPLFQEFLDDIIRLIFVEEKSKYIQVGFSIHVEQVEQEYNIRIYVIPYKNLYVAYNFQGVFYYRGYQFRYYGPVPPELLTEEGVTKIFCVEHKPGFTFKSQPDIGKFYCNFSKGQLKLNEIYLNNFDD